MRGDLVIGIDSSTTATKAIAFDARGRIVAEGRAPIPLSNPHPGWFEQEVSDWTGALTRALKQLTKKIDAKRVAGLAISNQRESFAQFDSKGKALRPGTLWLDERAQKEVKDIVAELGAEAVHNISGKPADVTPCLYRCRWLSTHMPKVWAKTAKTAEVHGVLTHFLTGQWATSTASADPMGLLDVGAYDWSDVLLKAARLTREQLPRLHRPGAGGKERERATDEYGKDRQNEDATLGIICEGMDRGDDARADDKGAEQRKAEGEDGQKDGPALQALALFNDDGRMQKCRREKPGHERGILDRIPEPEAAPAKLVIGPPRSKRDADGQEDPGRKRPRPHPAGPCGIDAALDQRRHGKGEGHREADIAEVEKRRMEGEARILQERVEILAVQRRDRETQEGV